MNSLVAFTLLVAAAVAEPQYFYSGYPTSAYYGGAYPVAGGYYGSPVIAKSVVAPYTGVPTTYSAAVTPYATVAYPSQDTSRGLPQPVQDTPEVKHAKAVFAKQYEQAAVTAALGSPVPVPYTHTIHKREALNTPASTVYTGPVAHVATPYYGGVTPYSYGVSAYTAGVVPYAGVSAYNYGAYPYYNRYY